MTRHIQYCPWDYENIENYELAKADNFEGWVVHHRLETHDKWGNKRDEVIPTDVLIGLGLYFNRPAKELVFMRKSDHIKLHKEGFSLSEEHKEKLRKAFKTSPLKQHNTPEQKKKISETMKGRIRSKEHCANISKSKKGKICCNNGKEQRYFDELPEGWTRGKLKKDVLQKIWR